MTQQASRGAVSPTTRATSETSVDARGGSASQIKDALRGKDLAAQEALVAPSEAQGATVAKAGPSGARAPAPKPDPIGAGLVLSRDPQYTGSAYATWFADQVKAKVESWGLTFDAKAVRVAEDGGKDVMALDWNPAWGTKPSAPIGFDMGPVDACAAIAGVHKLTGWAKTPSDDQPRLDALLGGQTNAVSAAGRENLRPKFAGLASLTADQQASTLTGLLGAADSAPGVVAEEVETAPVTLTLTGPTEQKAYPFRGGPADAEVWSAAYSDGSKLQVVAPKAPTTGMHQHTVAEAADAARFLPKKNRAAITTVMLNPVENPEDKTKWAVEYKDPDFHSYMTAGAAGVVTIYPDAKKAQPDANYMRGTMIHETGHSWSYQNWGEDETKGKWVDWKTAMGKDKNIVSQYATNSIAEDVAETIQVYGSTKGKPKYDEYKALVPNRFKMLETELA